LNGPLKVIKAVADPAQRVLVAHSTLPQPPRDRLKLELEAAGVEFIAENGGGAGVRRAKQGQAGPIPSEGNAEARRLNDELES
jgi:hypothetical protein